VAKFELVFKKSVSNDLRPIPNDDVARIMAKIYSLGDDPKPVGSIKLAGSESYRIRQGNYRIVYEIEDKKLIVVIVKVGSRKDVYR
jgi:mRNA interferase RelE/StbE